MSNVQLLAIYLKNYLKTSIPQIRDIILFSAIGGIIYLLIQYYKYGECHAKMMKKRILLIVGCSFIFVMTIWGRKINIYSMNFHISIIYTYSEIIFNNNMEMLLQVIMNIFMFIPLGIALPLNCKYFEKNKHIIIFAVALSFSIELIQGITGMGFMELNDIINNVLGAQIGALIYYGLKK